jgi:hypothetical protein
MKKLSIIILICFAVSPLLAQKNCLEVLRTIAKQASETQKNLNSNQITYLNYTIKNVYKEGRSDQKELIVENEILTGKGQYQMLTKQIQVYQNNKINVSVLPAKRVIYLTDADPRMLDQQMNQLSTFSDSITGYVANENCIEIDHQHANQKIELTLNEKGLNKFGISSVVYLINSNSASIYSVTMNYKTHPDLKRLVMTYNKTEFDYKGDKFVTNVQSKFFDRNMQLKAVYKNYKLIDVRAVSSK